MAKYVKFQSTLSQGERRVINMENWYAPGISIHALARRATFVCHAMQCVTVISIHALARRATRRLHDDIDEYEYFNPRSRKESDSSSRTASCGKIDFNPRSRKESDRGYDR